MDHVKWTIWKTVIVAYLKPIVKFIGARWLSPRHSENAPECAVMEIDLDLSPDGLNFLGAFLTGLSKFDSRVNTDHPVFMYLGKQAEMRQDSEIRFTVFLQRRPVTAAGKESQTDIREA